jgi:pimeloyl-ACP methyl ester carboxylesterase
MRDGSTRASGLRDFSASDGAILARLEPNAGGPMLLIFGAMAINDWAPFQLVETTAKLPADKIYLRDLHRAWYQLGLPPYAQTIDEAAALLADLILERNPRRVVSVGVSAGGFAALLFGHLLGVDETHAFSPRSYIDIDNRLSNDDFFMDDRLLEIYASPRAQPEYFDLRPLLCNSNGGTMHYIHYAEERRLDLAHVAHLAGAPNVELLKYDRGGHRLARLLRDDGRLERIIAQAIAGTTGAPDSEVTNIRNSAPV